MTNTAEQLTEGVKVVRHLPIVSTTELAAYRRCPREHHIRYRLRMRPVLRNVNLRFGSLVHRGLEAWWSALAFNAGGGDSQPGGADPLTCALAAIETPQEGEELDPFEQARAEVMLAAYNERWSGVELEVLAVEKWFCAPIVNPETGSTSRTALLGGKMDAICRIDGRVYVVEHKTATGDVLPGTPYWKKLRMDPQVSNYVFGLRTLTEELGFAEGDIAGCLYDVLVKPSMTPFEQTPVELWQVVSDPEGKKWCVENGLIAKQTDWKELDQETKLKLLDKRPDLFRLSANQHAADETVDQFRDRVIKAVTENPERYFQRGEVVRLEEDERDAAHDNWQQVRAMREAELARRAPRNPDACVRFGSECDFFPVCSRETSLSDPRFESAARKS